MLAVILVYKYDLCSVKLSTLVPHTKLINWGECKNWPKQRIKKKSTIGASIYGGENSTIVRFSTNVYIRVKK